MYVHMSSLAADGGGKNKDKLYESRKQKREENGW